MGLANDNFTLVIIAVLILVAFTIIVKTKAEISFYFEFSLQPIVVKIGIKKKR
ncbi:hypothetical protein [Wukongibacter baidiensis]